MAFRHGLISFLIIIVTSLILIIVGIVLLVKFRNGFNAVRGLSILLILIGIIMILFSKKVCIRNVRLKGNIDVKPLSEMHISQNVQSIKGIMEDIESFKELKVNTTNGVNNAGITEMLTGTDDKGSHLEVKILVFDSVESAFKSYNSRYKSYGKDYGIMEKGGTESDRYFITYINQLRASPESLYELMDSYMTYLYFQKNNIVISLREMRGQSESKIEKYIQLMANRLSKLE
ncbi:hypothetical protein [Pseudobacteroides cellulosolvens]|uniref:Uncharacterized protein n=1 Tax=Pseudobacteroides cellulosolvens ATCC 35603 = DSM 2933 TaxID=398512 RepID=A0A0L6JY78_9FIRM|nr:hypothetical protein [Pseudobacteroides cellulosolvens]KNY30500.1 hypothetical protein Bccel_5780 [Pseudobacteroides cellulosolvens ATCC 35603 = DSM 2933]